MNDTDDFLTTAEAAELLGWSAVTLNKLRHQGRGPAFYKLPTAQGKNGRVLYKREDVITFREAHRVEPEVA